MKRWHLGGILALVMTIALIYLAPARLLAVLLPGEQVLLQGYQGTLWRGSASRALVQVGTGYLHLGTVRWRLHPLSLLLLSPRLDIESKWGTQLISGELALRGGRDLDLRDFSANIAADLVRQYAPITLDGTLAAQFSLLQLREGLPYSAAGRLVWQGGGWQSPSGMRPLGSYALEVEQPAGEPLSAQVLTLSGPVQAAGTVRLQDRNYQLDVLVSSTTAMDPQLQQALSLLAQPESGGYRIRMNGEL